MSKNKIASFLIAVVLLLGIVPSVGAETVVYAAASYGKDYLTPGTLSAEVGISETGASAERGFIAALLYCAADGEVIDFSAERLETSVVNAAYGIYSAQVSLQLEIPSDVTEGQYVRAMVVDALSLEPISVTNGVLQYLEVGEPLYTGIYERYYTLDSESGSIAMDGSAVTVAEAGTMFRLKDMGDGYVAFEDQTASQRRMLYNNDGTVGRRIYGYGTNSMLWKLIPAEEGKYFIESCNGGYMAIENGAVTISESPCAFELSFAKESDFTLMTLLDGFKLLTEQQRQRIIEIYTSVGATVFPNGSNGSSILDTAEASFAEIFNNRDTLTAEKQRDMILEIAQTPPTYGAGSETNEINGVKIDSLPNGNAEIKQSEVSKENLYIWDTGDDDYNRIDVTYTSGEKPQTVKFYYNESGAVNVQTAIEALARFPYEYRQFIEQVDVYVPPEVFTYNCDGTVLTVRVPDNTSVETMVRNFAHELGHSIDFCLNGNVKDALTHLCQSAEWQQALIDDVAAVSKYGSENDYEGFAEFARLYFQSYGTRDRQIGVRQLFPNRYKLFNEYLQRLGMDPLY